MPSRYPHPARTVRLLETHISWILLAGRFAYKIKKAVNLGFLDARKLSARHAYCQEEMRLNRRLAPQLYLDAVAIGGTPAQPRFGVRPAIEYAVKMRRFNPARTLDRLADSNLLQVSHIDALAHTVAAFHLGLDGLPPGTAAEYSGHFRAAMLQNFAQLAPLLEPAAAPALLDTLQQTALSAFQAQHALLQRRWHDGYVRECHGDLHLGNIVLSGQQPVPFDGIDFSPALRWVDIIDEVAFTFMDLLFHRRPELAYRYLNAWLEHSGDYTGCVLLPLFASYRATVRAKINAIRSAQPGLSARQRSQAGEAAKRYLQLALECLHARSPRLLITHGLPGSGKSRLALAAAERLGAIRLRSDVERKRLFGLSALERSQPAQDIYSLSATRRTYQHLLDTARALLQAGHIVIVDAAFLQLGERAMFRHLAAEANAGFAIVSLQPTSAILRERVLHRAAHGNDASEAGIEVLEKLSRTQEPLTSAELAHTLVVAAPLFDTARPDIWQQLQERLALTARGHNC